jgi:anti-anti-sigma factor
MDTLHQDMTITVAPDRGTVVVVGEVDVSNAVGLRVAIIDAAREHEGRLQLDLAGITFIDSAGLMAIADASVALRSALVLCNVPRQVRRILAITGIGAALEVRGQ